MPSRQIPDRGTLYRFVILSALLSLQAFSQECTHLWVTTLDINPQAPKPMSGDTFAAYGLLGYHHQPHLRLEISGEFFRGRFMSFESYRTKQKLKQDVLFDYEIEQEAGSENPFREGVPLDTPHRSYTIDIVPEGASPQAKNVLHVSRKTRIHSVFYRSYVPMNGAVPTPADLPRIYAYDSRTGKPTACPKGINTVYNPGVITLLLNFVPEHALLKFEEGSFWNGTNSAIPKYVYVANRIRHGDVSLVRFRAPTYTNTDSGQGVFEDKGEVRYWSFCTQNLKESETLNCLPDFLAKIDAQGFVNLVIGKGDKVRAAALERGYDFLEDKRGPDQAVAAYFYRNLLPKAGFPLYKGDYLPSGMVCPEEDFLEGACK